MKNLSRGLLCLTLLLLMLRSGAQQVDMDDEALTSRGLAPAVSQSGTMAQEGITALPSSKVYGYCAAPNTSAVPAGPMYFHLNTPGTVISLANQATLDFLSGSSWAGGKWYASVYSATGNSALMSVDTLSGARTMIGMTGLDIGALAYDWIGQTMYAIAYSGSGSKLYTLDLYTGLPEFVANIGNTLFINLACSHTGQLYAVGLANDRLYSINKTTGMATMIGAIGFNANYAQDMEFDNSDSTMYFAAYNGTTNAGELRTVNLATGATTLVGAFNGNMEVTGFAIPNEPFIVYNNDVGIDAVVAPVTGPALDTNEQVTVRVKNYGNTAQSDIPVFFRLGNNPPQADTVPGPLLPDSVVVFTFTPTVNLSIPGSTYVLKIYTSMAGDQCHPNDTIKKSVQNLYTADLGITNLVEPATGPALPANALVKVEIKNFGTNPQSNFPVTYYVDTGTPVTDTVTATVAAGSTYIYTFTQTVNVSAMGTYYFHIYTGLATDQNHGNDTLFTMVVCTAAYTLIHDNGPFVTGTGNGAGGANVSELQSALGLTNYGYGHAVSSGARIADDFTISALQTWTINAVAFYAYQTGSTTTSTINNVNFRIWQGAPNSGGSIVWGDASTNRLSNSLFSNTYRVLSTSLTNSERPIMTDNCYLNPPIVLTAGTYWIDWQTGGTLTSGPWAHPITITGQASTGNALQYTTSGGWTAVLDATFPQGFPFKLFGSIVTGTGETGKPDELCVYPNPSTGSLTVKSNSPIHYAGLFDLSGRLVMEFAPGETEIIMNTMNLDDGMYFLRVVMTDKNVIKTVVLR